MRDLSSPDRDRSLSLSSIPKSFGDRGSIDDEENDCCSLGDLDTRTACQLDVGSYEYDGEFETCVEE